MMKDESHVLFVMSADISNWTRRVWTLLNFGLQKLFRLKYSNLLSLINYLKISSNE